MKNTQKLLQDMLDSIQTISSYSMENFEMFSRDKRSQDAIMYNLIILGEAANKIPNEFQESYPNIPRASIIGTRNVIVHGYDQIKLQIVWDIIKKDLENLKSNLLKII